MAGIAVRIAHRAQQRLVEWTASFQIMIYGIILLQRGDTYDSYGYSFSSLAQENTWGIVLFLIGSARVCGLIVNGARQDITPWIRAIGAFVGFFVFVSLSMSLVAPWIAGNAPAVGLAMFIPASVAELAAIYYSVQDAKAYRDGRRTS